MCFSLFIETLTQCTKGLHKFLKEQPFAYRDEMQAFIYDEYNIVVSISTISRALKRSKISRKKVYCGII